MLMGQRSASIKALMGQKNDELYRYYFQTARASNNNTIGVVLVVGSTDEFSGVDSQGMVDPIQFGVDRLSSRTYSLVFTMPAVLDFKRRRG